MNRTYTPETIWATLGIFLVIACLVLFFIEGYRSMAAEIDGYRPLRAERVYSSRDDYAARIARIDADDNFNLTTKRNAK